MIHQLIEYLRTVFPTYTFVTLLDYSDTQETIVVRETGGSISGYPMERVDATVQIVSRGQDSFLAKERIQNIYLELKEKFDFDLPAVPDLGLTALNIARIQANQFPGDLTEVGTGVYEYVVNFTLTYSDKPVSA